MPKKNLTNSQIHYKCTTIELIFRMNCLHAESNRRPEDAGVPMTDIWEAVSIIKELRRRLGRLGIFYTTMKEKENVKKGS